MIGVQPRDVIVLSFRVTALRRSLNVPPLLFLLTRQQRTDKYKYKLMANWSHLKLRISDIFFHCFAS